MAAERYAVVLTPHALRGLKQIRDHAIRRRLGAAIDDLQINPRPPGCKILRDDHVTAYRVRVGDYRILYTVEDKIVQVTVVTPEF